jgi:hypothetical protein
MEHGRDHDERQYKAKRPRRSNVPDDEPTTDLEAELSFAGRGGAAPHEGLVGAHRGRARRSASPGESELPAASGSEVAPTGQAARREQERHRIERELGHVAAGTWGHVRGWRAPDVDRATLDEAAREADRRAAERAAPPTEKRKPRR